MKIYVGLVLSALVLLSSACNKKQDIKPLSDMKIDQHWQFREVDSSGWLPATVPGCVHTDLLANHKIPDPFYRTNERKLQWIDKKDWEYKTSFPVDSETIAMHNLELCFKGLDTYADVYLNDHLILKADNMFREWNADVKPFLKMGNNTLRILFHSPITIGLQKLKALGYPLPATNDQSENGGLGNKKVSVFTRKAGYQYGWDWGPRFVTSGIWRPVHLLAWNNARIENIQYLQHDVSKTKASVTAQFEIKSAVHAKAVISVASPGDSSVSCRKTIDLKPGDNTASLDFTITHPHLWWTNGLGDPYLYHLTGKLRMGHQTIDQNQTHIGIRTLKIVQKPDSLGKSFYVELNGVPVFMKGANYIPNDNFLNRVTHAVYDKIVKSAADAHMNMLRVWGGGIYENNYFYDLADQHGILIWQDLMFACSMYPGDDAFLENARQEVIQNVIRLRNHPCIALWCGNNEIDVAWQHGNPHGGWGWKEQYTPAQRNVIWHSYDTLFQKIFPKVIATYDPGRFYWPSSPLSDWNVHSDFKTHSGDIHYWDVWWGQKPFSAYKTHIGRFMSEYGFQSFPEFNSIKKYTLPEDWNIFSEVMKAHQRSSIGNGTIKNYMQRYYKVPSDFRKFIYVGQVLQAEGIKTAMEAHRCKMPYCMGSLFWQLNDCWPVASWSSIDYYHKWKALQYFAKKAFRQVLVSPEVDSTGLLKVHIVSDALAAKKVILDLRIMNFKGRMIFAKKIPAMLPGNSSKIYFSDALKKLVPASMYKNTLLSARVFDDSKVITDNIMYFLPVKDLSLPHATILKKVYNDKNEIMLELSSDQLVKNLYLSLTHGDGFFSDNYFDILPGETVRIRFTPDTKTSVHAFLENLKLMQMADI